MLSVLDVGDGACSVLRFPGGRGRVTVIDCGSNSLTADEAADRLTKALRGRVTDIDTIIVTHFDTDHYLGFLRLAERMQASGERFDALTLVAPTIPMIDQTYSMAFLALTTTVTGFRSLDLADELRKVTAAGAFRYVPVARGWTMRAVGHDFRIHWPPHNLPSGVAGQVRRAVRQFEELADEMDRRGDRTLMENFERVRTGRWLVPNTGSEWAQVGTIAFGGEWAAGDLIEPTDGELVEEIDAIHGRLPGRVDLPSDLLKQFGAAWDSFRKANNNMSLVIDELNHRHLVAFGDAGPAIVRALSIPGEFAEVPYAAMLAPHHGTHSLPAAFGVRAIRCASQNGSKRGDKWENHRRSHRNHDRCYTTASQGNIELGQHAPWCRTET